MWINKSFPIEISSSMFMEKHIPQMRDKLISDESSWEVSELLEEKWSKFISKVKKTTRVGM